MTSPADVLRRARALIERPEAWTQGRIAETATGARANWKDPAATRFCAIGAVRRACGVDENGYFGDRYFDATRALRKVLGVDRWPDVADFNDADATTHAAVLKAFDAAIALAESEGRQG